VLKPVTSGLEPVVAPLIRAVEPALQPVTQPVLHSLSPVTQPALHALSPVTQPATQPVPHTTAPVTAPWVHADWTATPAAAGKPALSQPRENAMVRVGQAVAHQGGALEGMAWHTVAASVVPMSGSGGGGSPADVSGMSGSMSASPGGQHGGEYAVTTTGTVTPGTDRTWRVPPGGRASLYWLVCYGNDHPS
jgi:hypothetical protein